MAAQYISVITICVALFLQGQAQTQPTTRAAQTFCGSPPILLNANVSSEGETEGSVAHYTCYDGFLPSGSLQTVCRGGHWVSTGSAPSCQVQYCPNVPNIQSSSNSAQFSAKYTIGAIITYTCYSGYRLNSSHDRITCQRNKTWSTPLPVCSPVDCGPAPNVVNSNVSISSTYYPNSATYRCQPGYTLFNPNQFGNRNPASLSVSCLYTGHWGNLPECNPVDCKAPPSLRFGYKVAGTRYLYTDTVVFGCQLGYQIQGNNSVTCQASGKWSARPECVIVTCSNPPVVSNATVTSTSTVNYGNSTRYHCAEGFYMTGFSHVTCRADSTWTDPPTCNVVDCRTPSAILYGKHTWTDTTYKSKTTYTCNEGYKLIGVSEVTCLADGSWDTAPICQSISGAVNSPAALVSSVSSSDNSATIASLAVAVAVMGLITLFFLVFFAFKIYPHKSRLFSYASYKNGDETVNSNI